MKSLLISIIFISVLSTNCKHNNVKNMEAVNKHNTKSKEDAALLIKHLPNKDSLYTKPLITHLFIADPSARVFDSKIYLYLSHDVDVPNAPDEEGGKFLMQDYHVLSMSKVGDTIVDHGIALHLKNIPWAKRQLWAPDAAYKNGTYYLFFPAKNQNDVFQIGVATSTQPQGPFIAEAKPIENSYSMDPTIFKDLDGSYYMYFGGLWGGQLHKWINNTYHAEEKHPSPSSVAVSPRVVKMSEDLKAFAEEVRELKIVDKQGNPFKESDKDKRFFEGSWMHMYNGKYYYSYNTGDGHNICYAIGDNPYGPFTYQGIILKPVKGWTSQHSIVEHNGKWYLFYHDTEISNQTHLRNVKVIELNYNKDGSIMTIDPLHIRR
jgi:hypothetical protein